jgi:hypothetical protein
VIAPQVLAGLERQRRAAVARFARIGGGGALVGCGGAGTVAVLYWERLQTGQIAGLAFAALFVSLLCCGVAYGSFSAYARGFKREVAASLVRRVDPGLVLTPEQGLPQSDYDASRLFAGEPRPSRFRSEDGVHGSARGLRLRFSEIDAQYERRRDTGSSVTDRESVTIFRGVLVVVEGSGGGHGAPVVILPRAVAADAGLPGTPELRRVATGDGAFDAQFATYSAAGGDVTPELSAGGRALVSSEGLRRLLLELAGADGRAMRVALVGNDVYAAIASRRDLLEPPLFSSVEEMDVGGLVAEIEGIVEAAARLGRCVAAA